MEDEIESLTKSTEDIEITFDKSQIKRISNVNNLFDSNNPSIKQDIIRMISQYLVSEGYSLTNTILSDEAQLKQIEFESLQTDLNRLRSLILEGNWNEVNENYCNKPFLTQHKYFCYAVYRQQFLELIEYREMQKAFTFLNKRLKPLEHLERTSGEFQDMCYLLTAKSVHEATSFRNWEGVGPSRERLVEELMHLMEIEGLDRPYQSNSTLPPNHLVSLLKQSIAYQVQSSNRYIPNIQPKVETLLQNYSSPMIPNYLKRSFVGHKANVKCCQFLDFQDNEWILSGSSDSHVKIWDLETSECVYTLEGHQGRVWDLAVSKYDPFFASASGDSTVKIWNLRPSESPVNSLVLSGHSNDVYSVDIHPNQPQIATSGYDKTVRVYDIHQGSIIRTFSGHNLSVAKSIYNPEGNLLISGSKDNTVKFWDVLSGLCIRTLSSHLGEVTSVQLNAAGNLLLTSSKDSSIRLWDIRMTRPLKRFKGHQNTSKNFIRARFGPQSHIVGGSEDGSVYLWDLESGDMVQKLKGHQGVVFDVAYHPVSSSLISCSNDGLLMEWGFNPDLY